MNSIQLSVYSGPCNFSPQGLVGPDQRGLRELGVVLQSERSPVRIPVRAQAWAAASVPGWGVRERQPVEVLTHGCFAPSLSPSLSLSENHILNKQLFCGSQGTSFYIFVRFHFYALINDTVFKYLMSHHS